MAVRDNRAIHPAAHRINVEITGRAIEALRRRSEKVLGADHPVDMRWRGAADKLAVLFRHSDAEALAQ
jgi:hypothetical protein